MARYPETGGQRCRPMDLLAAATRMFTRDGIAKAQMIDIAAEAGVSVSSIYDYCPSKEDLAYEVPIRRLASNEPTHRQCPALDETISKMLRFWPVRLESVLMIRVPGMCRGTPVQSTESGRH